MKKFYLLIILVCITFNLKANDSTLKIVWLGTTTVYISDGETSLFFDPFITRPSKLEFFDFRKGFGLRKLESNNNLVIQKLDEIDPHGTIKAIFVSHTHYDHVLDLVNVVNTLMRLFTAHVQHKKLFTQQTRNSKKRRISDQLSANSPP